MNKYIITAFLLCVISFPVWSQNDGDDVRDVRRGNRDFKKENYREADIDYRKALVKDSTSVAANYNLANTLYRQGDMEQARKMLDRVKETAPATEAAADYYYNLGDVAIAQQDWQTAVDALEQSLLRNPGDLQAKENYIYARKKLQEQQNQQQNNQDQQNDQNDQNQDQQDNKDDQQNQDKNDDQNKNDDDRQDQKNDRQDNQDQNNDQQQDQQKPQQSQGEQPKISPQAAQQMLQAIQAKEKETQDKVNKEKAAALKARQKDKNW
ncbi:MAG: tetratricopeptide repeat protein [Bacteroidales bacterium]|nr:tetratricopeptide repeat protein [Bacteroidales bacterium]